MLKWAQQEITNNDMICSVTSKTIHNKSIVPTRKGETFGNFEWMNVGTKFKPKNDQ